MTSKQTACAPSRPLASRHVKQPGEVITWDTQVTGLGLRQYHKSDSVWIVQFRERGRQRKVTLGSRKEISREDARRQARGLMAGAALKLALADPSPDPKAPPTFAVFVEEYWAAKKLSWQPATQRTNRRFIDRYFIPEFGDKRVDDIARDDIMRWRDGLRATPGNANRALPVLSKIMDHAERLGLRRKRTNPCARVTRFKTGHVDRFLNVDEMARLGRALRSPATAPTLAAIVRLLLLTGARKGELLGLKWGWIDGARAALPDSKTGARSVYLAAPARRVLETLPQTSPWVFPNGRADGPIRAIDAGWVALRTLAGLPDVRLHDLRHSFASHAIAKGESAGIVGRLLGHALPESTQRYIHFAREDVAKAATRISGKLADAMRLKTKEGNNG